jgi:hypothetical protein
MARFLLLPCKIRADKVVPLRNVLPEEFAWEELVKRFVPSKRVEGLQTLSRLERNAFVGIIRHPKTGEPSCFLLLNPDRSGQIGWLLKQDATVLDRIASIYRVELAEYDRVIQEGVN